MKPYGNPGYSSHPRYSLRLLIVFSDVFGLTLNTLVFGMYPREKTTATTFTKYFSWLIVSIALSIADLVFWKDNRVTKAHGTLDVSDAERQQPPSSLIPISPGDPSNTTTNCSEKDNPDQEKNHDEEPNLNFDIGNPPPMLFFFDFVMSIVLFVIWTCVLDTMSQSFRWHWGFPHSVTVTIVSSYASTSLILSSVCHVVCSWKEIVTVNKKKVDDDDDDRSVVRRNRDGRFSGECLGRVTTWTERPVRERERERERGRRLERSQDEERYKCDDARQVDTIAKDDGISTAVSDDEEEYDTCNISR